MGDSFLLIADFVFGEVYVILPAAWGPMRTIARVPAAGFIYSYHQSLRQAFNASRKSAFLADFSLPISLGSHSAPLTSSDP